MRTIAHLSDLHFGRVDEELFEPLRRCLRGLPTHLVVVSGDLTQRAREDQFEQARDFLDTLPRPQLVVPGNHDVPLYDLYRRFVQPLERYRRLVSDDLQPSYIDDEIAVVGVNTARSFTFKGGRINEDQVEQVRTAICGLPEAVTKIIVSHHPFNAPRESGDEGQIVGRARMALEKLADCGADLLLSGHLHASHVGHTSDRYCIAGVSALVVHAGTALSSRVRGEPNSFNVLRVEPRRIVVERYEWRASEGEFAPATRETFHHDGSGWSPSA